MRGLGELLADRDGRALLERRGVLTSEEDFVDGLGPPAQAGLLDRLGRSGDRPLVYTAHQAKADYGPSVITKLRSAGRIDRRSGVEAALLWLDMDRAGADRSTTAIHLRGRGGALQVRLASRRHDDKEVRFVPVDRVHLEETLAKMGAWARQHGAAVAERHQGLAEAFFEADPGTLAEANLALTSFLLRSHLDVAAPSLPVSDLAARGLLADTFDEVVDRIDDVITVFNAAVDSLLASDVDPQVHHLGPDYLPLHYSCDRCGRRCSLARERRGADTFAAATCSCGASYRFHLGSGSLSMAELERTGRWSPDVTLPLSLNDLASGVVAGRSSALYGMVLNEVLIKVLARRPIPMLVPADLPSVLAEGAGMPSLLQAYLEGP
jgi:hypothetical protein